jgi:hypothetical protein
MSFSPLANREGVGVVQSWHPVHYFGWTAIIIFRKSNKYMFTYSI